MTLEEVAAWGAQRASRESSSVSDDALAIFLAALLRDPEPALRSSKARWVRWRTAMASAWEAQGRRHKQLDDALAIPERDESGQLERLEAIERAEAVRDAIGQLTPRERAYVRLHYFDGLSLREVARRCGAPRGTVKSYGWHARRRLARILRGLDR